MISVLDMIIETIILIIRTQIQDTIMHHHLPMAMVHLDMVTVMDMDKQTGIMSKVPMERVNLKGFFTN